MTTPKNPAAVDLQAQALALLDEAYHLMPLGTKKRAKWVSDVMDLYDKMADERRDA